MTRPETIRDSAERSAAAISALTIASRILGLLRTLVVTSVLGITFLGNTYASTNLVPNILFEIVAGGALAAVLVPSLAACVARQDRESLARTTSAFANLALLALSPVVIGGLVFRHALMSLLTASVGDPQVRRFETDLGSFLLAFFIPQVWLYSVGMVLTGLLHAHRRFVAPALAPLLSNIVVITSYLLYAALQGRAETQIPRVSGAGRLILGAGTTAGVAILSLSLLIPARRLKVSWKPVLKLPGEARGMLAKLLPAALLAVGSQQLLLGLVVVLGNRVPGGVVAYQLAYAVLLVFWSVFPLPMATASFPALADAVSRSDSAEFARRSSETARRISLLTFGGAALLVATAGPASGVMLSLHRGPGRSAAMVAATVASFAPGLIGYGLLAFLTRACYARGEGAPAGIAAVGGFAAALGVDLAALALVHGPDLIPALAGGFSAGMLAGAGFLLVSFRAAAGKPALDGFLATSGRSLLSALVAGSAGALVARSIPSTGTLSLLAATAATAAVTSLAYLALQRILGDRELGRALASLKGLA